MNYPSWRAGLALLSFYLAFAWPGLFLAKGTVFAATAPAAPLTLRAAIAATLETNPELDVYSFREQAIAGMRTTASLQPPLQLNGGIEDALGSGDLRGIHAAEFTLSLSQVVELGGQRDARVGIAAQRIDVLQAQQRITELDLLAQVTRFGGNISRTATFVGMERSALHRKLKSLGLHGSAPDERTSPDTAD